MERAEESGFQRVAVRTIPGFDRWRIAGGHRALWIVGPVPQVVGFDWLLRRKAYEDLAGPERRPRYATTLLGQHRYVGIRLGCGHNERG